MNNFLQLIFTTLEMGGVTALATMGVILIFRTSSAFNYAQGVIAMFCAFIAAHALQTLGWNVYAATIVGLVAALLLGIIIDRLIISRTITMHSVSKQIITLGLVIVLLGLAPMLFGVVPIPYDRLAPMTPFIFGGVDYYTGASFTGLFDHETMRIVGGARLSISTIVNVLVGIGIMALLFYIIQKTKWGLAVRATASNGVVARMMGIPTPVITMGAWAIAAALGTLSAIMVAPTLAGVTPSMMDNIQITALLACVLGGLGTFHGPVIAAYLIIFARSTISFLLPQWAEVIVFLLILLVLVFTPNGIFGKKVVKKV